MGVAILREQNVILCLAFVGWAKCKPFFVRLLHVKAPNADDLHEILLNQRPVTSKPPTIRSHTRDVSDFSLVGS